MWTLQGLILGLVLVAHSNAAPQTFQSPIFFKDGKLGVNFLGFHAGVGLNGLENGGGLHVEAGTPFGQKAAAGLGGSLGRNGGLGGQLYAGATAGGNIKAGAGLGGQVGQGGAVAGGLYSGASAGSAKAGSALSGGVVDGISFGTAEKVADVAPKKVVRVQTVTPRRRILRSRKRYYVRGHPVRFSRFFDAEATPEASKATQATTETVKPSVTKTKYVISDNEVRPPAVEAESQGPVHQSPGSQGPGSLLGAFFAPQSEAGRSVFDDIFGIPSQGARGLGSYLGGGLTKPIVEVEKTVSVL